MNLMKWIVVQKSLCWNELVSYKATFSLYHGEYTNIFHGRSSPLSCGQIPDHWLKLSGPKFKSITQFTRCYCFSIGFPLPLSRHQVLFSLNSRRKAKKPTTPLPLPHQKSVFRCFWTDARDPWSQTVLRGSRLTHSLSHTKDDRQAIKPEVQGTLTQIRSEIHLLYT